MIDRLFISDLSIPAIIGVGDDERQTVQRIVISVALDVDTRRAGETDAIQDTVNYATVAKEIVALVETSHFRLVEALARAIAGLCLTHEGVEGVTVRVEKPGAVRQAVSVGVEIYRARPSS